MCWLVGYAAASYVDHINRGILRGEFRGEWSGGVDGPGPPRGECRGEGSGGVNGPGPAGGGLGEGGGV